MWLLQPSIAIPNQLGTKQINKIIESLKCKNVIKKDDEDMDTRTINFPQIGKIIYFMEQGKIDEALDTVIICSNDCNRKFKLALGASYEEPQLNVICPYCMKHVVTIEPIRVRAKSLQDLIASKKKKPWWKLW